jgi:hypothetical protein
MLNKTFHPNEVETRLYAKWEKSGAFKAGKKANAPSFSIVIPPPNVTGNLHIGHALNNTLRTLARSSACGARTSAAGDGSRRHCHQMVAAGARLAESRVRMGRGLP